MPYAELVDREICVQTDWVDRELITRVPGLNHDPVRKLWHGPLSWSTCLALRGSFGPRLAVGPGLADWATQELAGRVEPSMQWRGQTKGNAFEGMITSTTGNVLFPFQDPDVSWLMWSRDGALLGNEMGAGKTISVVVAACLLRYFGFDPFPLLAIVPNSTKKTPWKQTFNEWDPEVEVFVCGGSSAQKKKTLDAAKTAQEEGKPVAVIMNWEAIRLHSRLAPYGNQRFIRCLEHGGKDPNVKVTRCEAHPKELNEFGFHTVVADEAHKMKDPKGKTTRAVWAVQHGPTVLHRWSTTGTPVADNPADVWPIMHGVAPHEYPTRGDYIDRYCIAGMDMFGMLSIIGVNPVTRDEFFAFFDARFRRMPKALVLQHLPPKLRSRRDAELGTKQAKAYKEVGEGMMTVLDDGSLVLTTNNLTQNLRLLQFSSAYATVNDDGQVRVTEPSSKLDVLDEIYEEMGNRPVVVCAEHRQLIELAAARLDEKHITYRMIVGGMTDDQREMALADFQAGRARVMLFTIKAGGVGLTMTAADTIVFLQRSWSMLENVQAEDRVHRIGSEIHESIHIVDIVAPGTVEEVQILRLNDKMARLQEIVRDQKTLYDAAVRGDLSAVAWMNWLRYEEQRILSSDLMTAA